MRNPELLTFQSDAWGYMLIYCGQPIGGAGSLKRDPKHWRHMAADRVMYAGDARREVAALQAGAGQQRMRVLIERIDRAALPA